MLVLKRKTPDYESKNMKRIGNLYNQICAIENLRLADNNARKGKTSSYGVKKHDMNREDNILKLQRMLENREFKTSQYHIFKIQESKERDIYQLPYFPDRIVHHAIMNIMEPIWMEVFSADTYACLKTRGIHGVVRNLKRDLKDTANTTYCLKMDIKKFYPSIDHGILKTILRKKIKDKDFLRLLDGIVDSAVGVPIGNYLSQFFANLYLAYFDHWIKEEKRIKYYYRYADDMVILSGDKASLHVLLHEIRRYMLDNLRLTVKSNYQVFPVDVRGIDFVGYRFFHTHILLRKSIKKNFARAVKRSGKMSKQIQSAYWGWAKHCNSKNLLKKLAA